MALVKTVVDTLVATLEAKAAEPILPHEKTRLQAPWLTFLKDAAEKLNPAQTKTFAFDRSETFVLPSVKIDCLFIEKTAERSERPSSLSVVALGEWKWREEATAPHEFIPSEKGQLLEASIRLLQQQRTRCSWPQASRSNSSRFTTMMAPTKWLRSIHSQLLKVHIVWPNCL